MPARARNAIRNRMNGVFSPSACAGSSLSSSKSIYTSGLADDCTEAIKLRSITMLRNVLLSLTGIFLALGAQVSYAQHDMSTLKPPAGSHVALIEFADMECPM